MTLTMLSRAAGSIAWDTWATWNTRRKASRCSEEECIRSQIEMSALTLLSWEVMSVLWCGFLVVEGDALGVGFAGLGAGDWLVLRVLRVG